jgi:hypothetical protein
MSLVNVAMPEYPLMAERPIFVPDKDAPGLVREISFSMIWHGGFAPVQKKKNIKALHEAAADAGFPALLEISTKSDEKLGQRLSAFSLTFHSAELGDIPLECAYQGSKLFERGGPYTDLYKVDVRTAKRDPRLKESGRITGFVFEGFKFPLEPKTVFYDWLYISTISTIFPHQDWLKERLDKYAGFTDIEFNPSKSINCQARSCALFVSLMHMDLLDSSIHSPQDFISLVKQHARRDDTIRSVSQPHQTHF